MAAEPTTVVFRKDREGEIIALFPEVDEGNYRCSYYVHLGGHSAASYQDVIASTLPAVETEYAGLQRELESYPYEYKLRVRTRYSPRRRK